MKKNQNIIEKALKLLFEAKKQKISNYQIAKETNISDKSIGNWLKNKTKPTPANAKLLISYFEGKIDKQENAEKNADFKEKYYELLEENRKLHNKIHELNEIIEINNLNFKHNVSAGAA